MGVFQDLTDCRFGHVVVIERTFVDGRKATMWRYKCDCGNYGIAAAGDLRSGRIKSCGCFRHQKAKERLNDLTGLRFGKLVVESRSNNKGSAVCWNCICDCGNRTVVRSAQLTSGRTKSCGCLKHDNSKLLGKGIIDRTGIRIGTYTVISRIEGTSPVMWRCVCDCGQERIVPSAYISKNSIGPCLSCKPLPRSAERLHRIWSGMKSRCFNPRASRYESYGGRGISVCKEWADDYLAFKKWALSAGYSDELSIDRIDVNGNYTPDNCRWATKEEQSRNRTANIYVVFDGKKMCLADACKYFDVSYDATIKQVRNGCDPMESILWHQKKKAVSEIQMG